MIRHIVSDYMIVPRVRKSWDRCRTEVDELRLYPGGVMDRGAKPQINEMLDWGCVGLAGGDIVVLTNSDSYLCDDAFDCVTEAMGGGGGDGLVGCWSHRVNVARLPRRSVWCTEVKHGAFGGKFAGVDLVALRVGWWKKLRVGLGPFWLGCECWDWVLRSEIRDAGGVEIGPVILHENHGQTWTRNRYAGTNLLNRQSAYIWSYRRGWERTMKELPGFVGNCSRPPDFKG